MTKVEQCSDFQFSKYTPYPIITGELWGVGWVEGGGGEGYSVSNSIKIQYTEIILDLESIVL